MSAISASLKQSGITGAAFFSNDKGQFSKAYARNLIPMSPAGCGRQSAFVYTAKEHQRVKQTKKHQLCLYFFTYLFPCNPFPLIIE
jgi:hypothetical protein